MIRNFFVYRTSQMLQYCIEVFATTEGQDTNNFHHIDFDLFWRLESSLLPRQKYHCRLRPVAIHVHKSGMIADRRGNIGHVGRTETPPSLSFSPFVRDGGWNICPFVDSHLRQNPQFFWIFSAYENQATNSIFLLFELNNDKPSTNNFMVFRQKGHIFRIGFSYRIPM